MRKDSENGGKVGGGGNVDGRETSEWEEDGWEGDDKW